MAFTPPERGLVWKRGEVKVGKPALVTTSLRDGGGPDHWWQQEW